MMKRLFLLSFLLVCLDYISNANEINTAAVTDCLRTPYTAALGSGLVILAVLSAGWTGLKMMLNNEAEAKKKLSTEQPVEVEPRN
jgi:hypothetical protein